jgi:uncharacterized repeat protein (TIGR02543 family)
MTDKRPLFRGVLIAAATALVATAIPTASLAATDVAQIGSTTYATLAAAVAAASDGDSITLLTDTTIDAGISYSGKAITLDGDGHTVTRASTYKLVLFTLSSSAGLTLSDVTIDGGAVWSDTALTAAAAKARTNSGVKATTSMIIANSGSTVTLANGSALDNGEAGLADTYATGITAFASTVVMKDGAVIQRLTGSGANYAAGIVLESAATFNMDGGTIRANCDSTDANAGAALFARTNSTANIRGTSLITQNGGVNSAVNGRQSVINLFDTAAVSANATASAVLVYTSGTINMYGHSTVTGNADEYGGILIAANASDPTAVSTANMYDYSSVTENTASGAVGGIYVNGGSLHMFNNSSITKNSTTTAAGGVYVSSNSSMTMNDNSTVANNSATTSAGGLYTYSGSSLTMNDNSSITNNTASSAGGGIYSYAGSTLTMNGNSSVANNSAALRGGGVYLIGTLTTNGAAEIKANAVTQCGTTSPPYGGGGLYIAGSGTAQLLSGNISGNTSVCSGTAILDNSPNLYVNGAAMKISGTIFLYYNSSTVRTVRLIGVPTQTYQLDTAESDSADGRDVVTPGSITVGGQTYSVSDTSGYAASFTHTRKPVISGVKYYGSGTTHDANLVLGTGFEVAVKTVGGGTVTQSGGDFIPGGTAVTFTATPARGYSVSSIVATDANSNTVVISGNTFTMPSSNVSLVVTFVPNHYTIVFDANGGSGTMSNLTATYDTAISLTANKFTRSGYVFRGWSTTRTGAVKYANRQSVTNLAASGTVTLYAQWVAADDSSLAVTGANGMTAATVGLVLIAAGLMAIGVRRRRQS